MLTASRLLGALRRAEQSLLRLGFSGAVVQQCIESIVNRKVYPLPMLRVRRRQEVETPEENDIYLAFGEDEIQARLREAEGARSLLLEIIRRAIFDWLLYRDSTEPERKQLALEAYVWLFEEDENHPDYLIRVAEHREFTSFVSICRSLDINIKQIRDDIRQLQLDNNRSGKIPKAGHQRKANGKSSNKKTKVARRGRVGRAAQNDNFC